MASRPTDGFTPDERAAMKARAREAKAEARAAATREDGERAVTAALAELPDADRILGAHVHALVADAAPALVPRLWYGMPAYADAAGKVVCFFQAAHTFKTRYATLGFTDAAALDDGPLWPVAFAVAAWTPEVEAALRARLAAAVG